jgi:hypothetical protein
VDQGTVLAGTGNSTLPASRPARLARWGPLAPTAPASADFALIDYAVPVQMLAYQAAVIIGQHRNLTKLGDGQVGERAAKGECAAQRDADRNCPVETP